MFTNFKDTLYFTGGFINITMDLEDEDGIKGTLFDTE